MVKILFVCMGNICRSPTAEGVFTKLLEKEGLVHLFQVDSAGTQSYHAGEPPDGRAQQAAMRRGINLSRQRARHVKPRDLEIFDYVVAMDEANLADLEMICPSGHEHKLKLFMEFAPHYGEEAAQGLLDTVRDDL